MDGQSDGMRVDPSRKEAVHEFDECYVLGRLLEDVPDIAIEVVHRHGGIDKLGVYAGLGIQEVWYWDGERLTPYLLRGDAYERSGASELLPGLDLEQLSGFVRGASDQSTAVREY